MKTMTYALCSMLVVCLFMSGCGENNAAVDDAAEPISTRWDPGDRRYADCETPPIGGVPWTQEDQPESRGDFEQILAETDISGLEAEIDISGYTSLDRGFIAYALEWDPYALGHTLDRDMAMAVQPLGPIVLASIVLGNEYEIDLDFFRQGFHRYHACTRQLPATLDVLLEDHDVDLPSLEVTELLSVAKCRTRRIRADVDKGVYIAQTISDEGAVVESEVILQDVRPDGQLEFVSYDHDGILTDRSIFPAGRFTQTDFADAEQVEAVPFVCMGCHTSINVNEANGFDQLLPRFGSCSDDV